MVFGDEGDHEEEPMTTSQRPLHDLNRKECLELLQYHSFVGRLGFVLDRRPMVLPVNYLADEDAVVFCTSEGTALGAVGEGHQVVFEVDESHPLERTGWSVVVRGTASVVTDPGEVEALRRGPLHSWVTRAPERWVRITIEEVTGRRLGQR
jgi:nitroimidazol reductase NimA-like FMN-containing flavoprotein (pyridoxamine 5'-phosphate oxidase superfamily)